MQKKIYQLLGGANDASVGLYVLSWAILILVILGITFFIRWRVKVFLKERRDSKTDRVRAKRAKKEEKRQKKLRELAKTKSRKAKLKAIVDSYRYATGLALIAFTKAWREKFTDRSQVNNAILSSAEYEVQAEAAIELRTSFENAMKAKDKSEEDFSKALEALENTKRKYREGKEQERRGRLFRNSKRSRR